jgi:excisionase family DNA binding protein
VTQKQPDPVRTLTPDEAAEYLGIGRRQLMKELVYKREIPHIRISAKRIVFLESDLTDYLLAHRVGYAIASPREVRPRRKSKDRGVKGQR